MMRVLRPPASNPHFSSRTGSQYIHEIFGNGEPAPKVSAFAFGSQNIRVLDKTANSMKQQFLRRALFAHLRCADTNAVKVVESFGN